MYISAILDVYITLTAGLLQAESLRPNICKTPRGPTTVSANALSDTQTPPLHRSLQTILFAFPQTQLPSLQHKRQEIIFSISREMDFISPVCLYIKPPLPRMQREGRGGLLLISSVWKSSTIRYNFPDLPSSSHQCTQPPSPMVFLMGGKIDQL